MAERSKDLTGGGQWEVNDDNGRISFRLMSCYDNDSAFVTLSADEAAELAKVLAAAAVMCHR